MKKNSLRLCVFAFNYLHAALHSETGRNSGKNCRQRLKNEFPSFLFHLFESLIVNNELLSPFRKTN